MYKVLISYSKSHSEMSDIFKKSFHSVNRNSNFTLIEDFIPNQVGNGNYNNPFFSEMVQQKVISISNLLDKIEDGEIIIFSDVDIILARDFSSEVEKYMSGDIDFACQAEYESKFGEDECCTGFMFIRNSQRIRDFMVKLRENMVNTNYFDQICFNMMKDLINYRKLPSTYFNISHGFKARHVWGGNTSCLPPLPQNTAIVHANWTIGSENKIKMMNHYWKELNNS